MWHHQGPHSKADSPAPLTPIRPLILYGASKLFLTEPWLMSKVTGASPLLIAMVAMVRVPRWRPRPDDWRRGVVLVMGVDAEVAVEGVGACRSI